jgi:hypothetical protein
MMKARIAIEKRHTRTGGLHFMKCTIMGAATMMLIVANASRAQISSPDELTIQPTAADRSAALAATTRYRHASPAHTAAGQALHARETAGRAQPYAKDNPGKRP